MAPEQRQTFRPTQNFFDQARETVSGAYEQAEDLVRQNPATSALITFGLGFCAGLVLMSMVSMPRQQSQSWYDSLMPDGTSRKQLSDTLAQFLSEAMHKVRG